MSIYTISKKRTSKFNPFGSYSIFHTLCLVWETLLLYTLKFVKFLMVTSFDFQLLMVNDQFLFGFSSTFHTPLMHKQSFLFFPLFWTLCHKTLTKSFQSLKDLLRLHFLFSGLSCLFYQWFFWGRNFQDHIIVFL